MFGALSNESEAETKQEYANSLAAQQAEVAKQLAPLQEKQEQIELRSARCPHPVSIRCETDTCCAAALESA